MVVAAAVEVGAGSLGAAAGSLLLSALLLGIIINSLLMPIGRRFLGSLKT